MFWKRFLSLFISVCFLTFCFHWSPLLLSIFHLSGVFLLQIGHRYADRRGSTLRSANILELRFIMLGNTLRLPGQIYQWSKKWPCTASDLGLRIRGSTKNILGMCYSTISYLPLIPLPGFFMWLFLRVHVFSTHTFFTLSGSYLPPQVLILP